MYNLNTREGKKNRISTLEMLMAKVGRGKLDANDQRLIFDYLKDIKLDLEMQLFEEEIKESQEKREQREKEKREQAVRYETSRKMDNGRYLFVGWNELRDEQFCINTKENSKFIYKTYKWNSGEVETLRYRK